MTVKKEKENRNRALKFKVFLCRVCEKIIDLFQKTLASVKTFRVFKKRFQFRAKVLQTSKL